MLLYRRVLIIFKCNLNLAGIAALVGTILSLARRQMRELILNEIGALTAENALLVKI
jgi:hypothetical protein